MMGSQGKFFRSFSRVELQTLSFVIFTGFFFISVTLLVLSAGHFVSLPSLGSWLSPRASPLPRAGENDTNNQNVDLRRKPLCDTSDRRADICDMEGDIRIQASSSSIFFVTSSIRNTTELQQSWKIKPHPRKGDRPAMSGVTEMSVGYLSPKQDVPKCDINSTVPAIIFATGGYMGNFFHEVSDSIIPLYISSHKFNGEVQFLVSEMLPWWMTKYERLLKKLSHHEIINFNKDAMVRCYPRVIVGIAFHKDMGIDPARSGGVTMFDFGRFIRSTYSLERKTATKLQGANPEKRPRLLIIARSRTRRFTNVNEIVQMVGWEGFEPVVAEIKKNQSIAEFARLVNSCDVILGVHGAGLTIRTKLLLLTNLIFLPTNAVVIQVVPLGGMDSFCYADYGVPTLEMKMKYLQYGIGVMESSLVDRYGITDPVVINPKSVQVQKEGWSNWTSIYFFNQDVKLDVDRFRSFLIHARELLRE
ncbi:alpha-1,3-arabinosyltransferase XAT3-like [Curcuma longa]|uniref:alpha-1,3-arabinosyltransferase XAT3-like n=1 Tax=Curcuma longa TaxID=136217 RepID=UPI003D9E6402